MKIKSVFFTVMAVFAFMACDNEVLNISNELNEGDMKEKGYLVLNVTNPPTTRTSGENTDSGTAAESLITSLTVVLTDVTGKIVSFSTQTIANGVSEKFEVALGTYDVYALINIPEEVEVELGKKIEQVIEVAEAIDATSGFKGGSFFMVNKCHNDADKAGVTVTINSSHSISNPAAAFIYVDRVACKIVIDTGKAPTITNLTSATGGVIKNVEVEGIAALNVNKQFNLIQTWNQLNAGGIPLDAKVLSTPLFTGTSQDLIAEQYFNNIGEFTTIQKDVDGKIIGILDETVGDGFYSKNPVYTTENRPTIIANGDDLTAGRGETTGVIYKVKAKKDGDTDLGTFYIFKNVFYTSIAAIQALQEFDGVELEDLSIPSLRALGIKVYEEGVMYYTYFIRDPNVNYQYKGKNYYGVFRNSTYKLAINTISSLGDDVPGGTIVDPTKPGEPGNPPIDTEETYIQVSVVVNKWILNTLNIDF